MVRPWTFRHKMDLESYLTEPLMRSDPWCDLRETHVVMFTLYVARFMPVKPLWFGGSEKGLAPQFSGLSFLSGGPPFGSLPVFLLLSTYSLLWVSFPILSCSVWFSCLLLTILSSWRPSKPYACRVSCTTAGFRWGMGGTAGSGRLSATNGIPAGSGAMAKTMVWAVPRVCTTGRAQMTADQPH